MNKINYKFAKTLISAGLSLALTACGSDSEEEVVIDDIITDITNTMPAISSKGILTVAAGAKYSYTLTSTDSDGDSLTLTASTLPAWLSFDADSGILSGTPEDSDIGDHPVTLMVSDGTDDLHNLSLLL